MTPQGFPPFCGTASFVMATRQDCSNDRSVLRQGRYPSDSAPASISPATSARSRGIPRLPRLHSSCARWGRRASATIRASRRQAARPLGVGGGYACSLAFHNGCRASLRNQGAGTIRGRVIRFRLVVPVLLVAGLATTGLSFQQAPALLPSLGWATSSGVTGISAKPSTKIRPRSSRWWTSSRRRWIWRPPPRASPQLRSRPAARGQDG